MHAEKPKFFLAEKSNKCDRRITESLKKNLVYEGEHFSIWISEFCQREPEISFFQYLPWRYKDKEHFTMDLWACLVAAKRAGSLLLTLFQQVILIHKLFFFSRRISLTKKEHAGSNVFLSLNLRSEQASKCDTLFWCSCVIRVCQSEVLNTFYYTCSPVIIHVFILCEFRAEGCCFYFTISFVV